MLSPELDTTLNTKNQPKFGDFSPGNSQFAVERRLTENGSLVSGPGEHGQWDGDGDVDADLSCVDLLLELASGRAGLGENGRSVTVCDARISRARKRSATKNEHLLELITRMASSRSFAFTMVRTGPKISSLHQRFISILTPLTSISNSLVAVH